MEKILILNIYIISLACLTHCVNSIIFNIGKFNFIGCKLNKLNNFGVNLNINNFSNTPSDGDSSSNTSFDVVNYNNHDSSQGTRHKLFDSNNRKAQILKLPIKCVLDSLLPEIFRVFDARRRLGCSSLPSLLCCSGGVDSMSLLLSFGLIKQNYEFLVNTYFQLNSNKYHINTSGGKMDKESKKIAMMNLFDEFYKNFNVVYFNHKQRDDVDRDVEVIRNACEEYKFNLIIEELPSSILQEEVRGTGLQNLFRTWRRETCIKIINHLSSINIKRGANDELQSTTTCNSSILNSIKNVQLKTTGLQDLEFESITNIGDLVDLKGLIFMGHNLDDNFETLLLKIIRGSFASNLTPMELYDNLDHREYILVRPFINLKKPKLVSFIQSLNGSFNEDSSNSKLYYTRNLLRNSVIPEVLCNLSGRISTNDYSNELVSQAKDENKPLFMGLHTKLKYLSKQCHNINSMLDQEVDMFYYYVNSKYKTDMGCGNVGIQGAGSSGGKSTANVHNLMRDSHDDSLKHQVKDAYKQFYTNLFHSRYNGNVNKIEATFESNINYLKRIGLRFDNHFQLKDWNVIPNRMIREQVLYRFIVRNTGTNILYRNLYKLVNDLSKEPFSENLKMYSVGSHLMYHQAYYLKFGPTISRNRSISGEKILTGGSNSLFDNKSAPSGDLLRIDRLLPGNRKLIYGDDNVTIYNSTRNLNVGVFKPNGRYLVNLKLEPAPASNGFSDYNDSHENAGNGSERSELVNCDRKTKLELDIRYLKEDDVSTSRKLWSNTVYKILSNVGLHRFLKDEIPAIVISGTNNVIGLFGYNLSPPYRNRDSQTIYYQTHRVKHPSQYQITIL